MARGRSPGGHPGHDGRLVSCPRRPHPLGLLHEPLPLFSSQRRHTSPRLSIPPVVAIATGAKRMLAEHIRRRHFARGEKNTPYPMCGETVAVGHNHASQSEGSDRQGDPEMSASPLRFGLVGDPPPPSSARHRPRQKSGRARDQSQSAVSRHRSERSRPRLPWHSRCPLAGIGRGTECGAWLDAPDLPQSLKFKVG
jgi:hypothetical protein